MKSSYINKGFVRMVLLIIVSLLLLSYFRIDLRNLHISDLWNSDLNTGNITLIWDITQNLWYNYIKAPLVETLELILKVIR